MNEWKAHTGELAWPTLLLTAALLAASVAIPAAVLGGLLPLPVGSLLMLVVCYGWFTPLHEAVHGNVGGTSSRRWLDTGIGWLAATAYLAPYPAFRAAHLRHHGVVNRDKDPDLWVASDSMIETSARCLTIVPKYYVQFLGSMAGESRAMRNAALQAVAYMGLLAVVGIALVYSGYGWEFLALWALPGWLASGLLAYAFDYLPHHPHDDTGRFTNSRILLGGSWLTVVMGGQNYHLIHHLWPRVPFYRYAIVFRRTRGLLEAEGAPIETVRLGA